MVDVRDLLDEILGGAGRQQDRASLTGRGGIEDILGQLGGRPRRKRRWSR